MPMPMALELGSADTRRHAMSMRHFSLFLYAPTPRRNAHMRGTAAADATMIMPIGRRHERCGARARARAN